MPRLQVERVIPRLLKWVPDQRLMRWLDLCMTCPPTPDTSASVSPMCVEDPLTVLTQEEDRCHLLPGRACMLVSAVRSRGSDGTWKTTHGQQNVVRVCVSGGQKDGEKEQAA